MKLPWGPICLARGHRLTVILHKHSRPASPVHCKPDGSLAHSYEGKYFEGRCDRCDIPVWSGEMPSYVKAVLDTIKRRHEREILPRRCPVQSLGPYKRSEARLRIL